MDFIYDRQETDLLYMTPKAYINSNDMNRIEGNIKVIASQIGVTIQSAKTNWKVGDLPRVSDYTRILENTRKIRNGYRTKTDTPAIPTHPINTYQKWNDIEHILFDVNQLFLIDKGSKDYTTEIKTGDKIGVI